VGTAEFCCSLATPYFYKKLQNPSVGFGAPFNRDESPPSIGFNILPLIGTEYVRGVKKKDYALIFGGGLTRFFPNLTLSAIL